MDFLMCIIFVWEIIALLYIKIVKLYMHYFKTVYREKRLYTLAQKIVTFFSKSEANLRSNLGLFNKLSFFSLPVYVVLVP